VIVAAIGRTTVPTVEPKPSARFTARRPPQLLLVAACHSPTDRRRAARGAFAALALVAARAAFAPASAPENARRSAGRTSPIPRFAPRYGLTERVKDGCSVRDFAQSAAASLGHNVYVSTWKGIDRLKCAQVRGTGFAGKAMARDLHRPLCWLAHT
jgi:hypothetical protein